MLKEILRMVLVDGVGTVAISYANVVPIEAEHTESLYFHLHLYSRS